MRGNLKPNLLPIENESKLKKNISEWKIIFFNLSNLNAITFIIHLLTLGILGDGECVCE